jgi:hypothetical protein
VVLHLPETGGTGGAYGIGDVTIDGVSHSGVVAPADLAGHSRIDVWLTDEGDRAPAKIEERDNDAWRQIFQPRTPRITGIAAEGSALRLSLSTNGEEANTVTYAVYRDGERIADGLSGTTSSYTDQDADPQAARSPCYAVETCFTESGNCSQHSPPMCWFGEGGATVQSLPANEFNWNGGSPSSNYGRFHHENWGDPGHSLETPSFHAGRTGLHHIELVYGNGAGPFDTGIAAAVKHVTVIDTQSDQVVGEGFAVMPHLATWDRWEGSSLVSVELEQGRSYRIVVGDHPRAVNMTVFSHFEAYTAGTGGAAGAFNRVNIAEVKILPR